MYEKNTALNPESEATTGEKTMPENSLTSGDSAGRDGKDLTKATGENGCDADSSESFESLIKGRYKKEFSEKVQDIINKRFKENKTREETESRQKAADEKLGDKKLLKDAAELVAMGFTDFRLEKELENPTFKALISGGLDLQTAYKATHFDEIMDNSIEYGATLAAKELADSIRFKVARPFENGLSKSGGFAPSKGAAGLTPEKRRELAKKALMGENISF